MTPEQRHALLIVSSILQGLIQREDEIVKVNIDPPWRGTIGEALDLADRALEPGELRNSCAMLSCNKFRVARFATLNKSPI